MSNININNNNKIKTDWFSIDAAGKAAEGRAQSPSGEQSCCSQCVLSLCVSAPLSQAAEAQPEARGGGAATPAAAPAVCNGAGPYSQEDRAPSPERRE